MDWVTIAVVSQIVLTAYFVITHWIPLYPWNDLSHEVSPSERSTNLMMQILQIVLIISLLNKVPSLALIGAVLYSWWMIGHVMAWWVPYFRGVTPQALVEYQQYFGRTYKFLPAIANHPIPNACHTVLGILSVPVFVSTWLAFIQLVS